jgi:uncharacterized repeat protein (TIGR03803 family)
MLLAPYKVVHRFTKVRDGSDPEAGLLNSNGVLYGTTTYGGTLRGCSGLGCGTVFSIGPPSEESVVARFAGGIYPAADLIAVRGALYGTTTHGGYGTCYCQGTVFELKLKPKPDLLLLYSFHGGKDGAFPSAALVPINGSFYGTTRSGGDRKCNRGTIFKLTPSEGEYSKTTLHAFIGGSDGASPYGGLTYLQGKLYGTTTYGGVKNSGTVFRIAP